jgi:hypothetical protein
MKKLLQISIVLVLALALIIGLFQIGIGGELPTAGNSCHVGSNTTTNSCLALLPSPKVPGSIQRVGWNG